MSLWLLLPCFDLPLNVLVNWCVSCVYKFWLVKSFHCTNQLVWYYCLWRMESTMLRISRQMGLSWLFWLEYRILANHQLRRVRGILKYQVQLQFQAHLIKAVHIDTLNKYNLILSVLDLYIDITLSALILFRNTCNSLSDLIWKIRHI